MRIGLNIVGVILVILRGIWFLQGINVLPGSFMTGQTRWAVIGGIPAHTHGKPLLNVSGRFQPPISPRASKRQETGFYTGFFLGGVMFELTATLFCGWKHGDASCP